MIRTRLSLVIIPLFIGLIAGYYLEGLLDPSVKQGEIYQTIDKGYLANDVNTLELVIMLEDLSTKYPDIVHNIFSELLKNEIVLKVPAGGRFKIIKTIKSNLSPKHLFVELKGLYSDTTSWVCSTSVKKVKKGDVK